MAKAKGLKPVGWIGSSLDALRRLSNDVRDLVGHAIYLAQLGDRHRAAKPLKGFGGAAVLEVVEDHDGNTYRAVYTVKFARVVYVLHVFQKKSKSGIKTPKHEIDLIKQRLRTASKLYEEWLHEHPEEL